MSQSSVALRWQDPTDRAFRFAWDMCTFSEGQLAAVHIEYRWAAALLGKAYEDKIAQIRRDDLMSSNDRTRNRYGKGLVRTEALVSLLKLVRGMRGTTTQDDVVLKAELQDLQGFMRPKTVTD
ncbi:hypothetical protein NX059_012181 [Plenodomus lindquistii]|nr:hypothetical protein NX059_012181 [Plenodomus lindquistii]